MPREVRWPRVMEAALGDGYEVIEEGLNGRCTVWDTPIEQGRCGLDYLYPCLLSHAPVDLVIIMLGTNDLKRIYGVTAAEIACGAARLVDVAKGTLAGPDDTPPRVLLVSPVPLGEITAQNEMWGFGESRGESRRLAGMYRDRGRGPRRRLPRRRVGGGGPSRRWRPPRRQGLRGPRCSHGPGRASPVRGVVAVARITVGS